MTTTTTTTTTTTDATPRAARPMVRLFSDRAVGWLTFCLGAPTGCLLIADNWRRLGQRGRAARYAAAAALLLVVFVLVGGILGQLARGSALPINMIALFFLRERAAEGDAAVALARGRLVYQNAWQGVALGVGVAALTLGATLVVALTLAPRFWAR